MRSLRPFSTKTCPSKKNHHHAQRFILLVYLLRLPREHILRVERDLHFKRQRILVWELACCESESMIDTIIYCNGWLRLLRAYLKLALIAKTSLSTYAMLATHGSRSLQKMMTASCTLIISSVSCHIATWLCGARECSMINTIVLPLSAPTSDQPRTMTRVILGALLTLRLL